MPRATTHNGSPGIFANTEETFEDQNAPSDMEQSTDEVVEEEMGDPEDGEIGEGSPETEKIDMFDTTGLKEIGNLASWTVSTSKPGCGVEALRDEDTNLFWQSDGPQPHLLNIHFFKLVSIVHIRLYLDFDNDESYTPTKMSFLAGTSHHDLQEFVELTFEQPKGWIDVDLTGVGGNEEEDEEGLRDTAGNILRAFLVQVRVSENHQNGKDTHIRGLQIFARDKDVNLETLNMPLAESQGLSPTKISRSFLEETPWMRDPELR